LVVVFRILAALLLAAALAQAVRLGVRRGDWIAIKLLVGFVAVMAAILILAPRLPLGN
jgi:N-acetylglucosamine kinase-like BadF-type ATPase